jgi:predicted nucleotidyltransferase
VVAIFLYYTFDIQKFYKEKMMTFTPHTQQAVKALSADFGASEIWQFGSSCTGTDDEHSDIDLLIVRPARPESTRPSVEARLCLYRHGIHHPFDLMVLSPERWQEIKCRPVGIYREVLEHGEKIYER